MNKYIAYWYEDDALDHDTESFLPDNTSSKEFTNFSEAKQYAFKQATRHDVQLWCSVHIKDSIGNTFQRLVNEYYANKWTGWVALDEPQ